MHMATLSHKLLKHSCTIITYSSCVGRCIFLLITLITGALSSITKQISFTKSVYSDTTVTDTRHAYAIIVIITNTKKWATRVGTIADQKKYIVGIQQF